MARYFAGLELPETVRERLAQLCHGLPAARWVAPENFHLTLQFIGDVPEPDVEAFAAGLYEIGQAPFALTLSGLGVFGHRKVRAAWAGVGANGDLARLQRAVWRAAEVAGCLNERRKFTPHVTLARFNRAPGVSLAGWLASREAYLPIELRVERFVLFASHRARGGGPYSVEAVFDLEGSGTSD